jgi:hypothetical protein
MVESSAISYLTFTDGSYRFGSSKGSGGSFESELLDDILRIFLTDVCYVYLGKADNYSKSLTGIYPFFMVKAASELSLEPKATVLFTALLPWLNSMVCVLMP